MPLSFLVGASMQTTDSIGSAKISGAPNGEKTAISTCMQAKLGLTLLASHVPPT
jgi:hypothetical protein